MFHCRLPFPSSHLYYWSVYGSTLLKSRCSCFYNFTFFYNFYFQLFSTISCTQWGNVLCLSSFNENVLFHIYFAGLVFLFRCCRIVPAKRFVFVRRKWRFLELKLHNRQWLVWFSDDLLRLFVIYSFSLWFPSVVVFSFYPTADFFENFSVWVYSELLELVKWFSICGTWILFLWLKCL